MKIKYIGVPLVVLTVAIFFLSKNNATTSKSEENQVKLPSRQATAKTNDDGNVKSEADNQKLQHLSNRNFEVQSIILDGLLDRWKELINQSSSDIANFETRKKLAVETIEKLGYSAEFFEIANFLYNAPFSVDSDGNSLFTLFFKMFESDEEFAKQTVDSFLRLTKSHTVGELNTNSVKLYKEQFYDENNLEGHVAIFAKSMTEIEFADFLKVLGDIDPRIAQEAIFSRALSRMTKEGSDAGVIFGDLVKQKSMNIHSANSAKILLDASDSVTDSAAIQDILNSISGDGFPGDPQLVKKMANNLYSRWAQADPETVSKHIFANPSQYEPELMRRVASVGFDVLLQKSGEVTALQWLVNMPNGEFKNAAVRGAALSYSEVDIDRARKIAYVLNSQERALIFGDSPLLH